RSFFIFVRDYLAYRLGRQRHGSPTATRRRAAPGGRADGRQLDPEERAAFLAGLVVEGAPVLEDDLLHDGQAEARAFGLRRVVGVEDALDVVRGDPAAVVPHGDDEAGGITMGLHPDLAATIGVGGGCSLRRVAHEVVDAAP